MRSKHPFNHWLLTLLKKKCNHLCQNGTRRYVFKVFLLILEKYSKICLRIFQEMNGTLHPISFFEIASWWIFWPMTFHDNKNDVLIWISSNVSFTNFSVSISIFYSGNLPCWDPQKSCRIGIWSLLLQSWSWRNRFISTRSFYCLWGLGWRMRFNHSLHHNT